MNEWIQKLLSREALWPVVGIVVSVVWLFRSPMGTAEFESWSLSFGGLSALLTGGVLAAKKINPPACVPGPAHGCPTSAPAIPGGGVAGEDDTEELKK